MVEEEEEEEEATVVVTGEPKGKGRRKEGWQKMRKGEDQEWSDKRRRQKFRLINTEKNKCTEFRHFCS